jgi:hemerythrin
MNDINSPISPTTDQIRRAYQERAQRRSQELTDLLISYRDEHDRKNDEAWEDWFRDRSEMEAQAKAALQAARQ